MDLNLFKRIEPKYALRLFLYFTAACGSMILSNIVTSAGMFILVPVISIVFTSLLFSALSFYAIIPSLIPIIIIIAVSGLSPAVSAAGTVIFSGVIGILLKRRVRPSFIIAFAAGTLVLTSAVYVVGSSLVQTGSFSVSEYFVSLSQAFDSVALSIAKFINESGEFNFSLDASVYSIAMKSIFIGVYIATQLIIACICYYAVILCARWLKDKTTVGAGFSFFDPKPTTATVWVYIISLVLSPMMSSNSDIHFYTHLATNISILISPIFFFAGLYYLVKIKFTKEHSSPMLLIICAAASLLFGLLPVIPIYITFCGVVYSIRYRTRKANDSPEANSDERND